MLSQLAWSISSNNTKKTVATWANAFALPFILPFSTFILIRFGANLARV